MFEKGIDLSRLTLSWKVLFSGFVIILAVGYLSAALNASLSVGVSVDAIAEHYGDKSLSAEEKTMFAQQGFIEEEFSFDDEEEMTGMDHSGHDMSKGMDMPMNGGHGAMAPADDSLPPQIFAQVSHVHLLAFSLLLISLGSLTCMTRLSEGIKVLLVGTLFISFLSDIVGLSLTRFVSDGFAWMTMIAGTLVGICIAIMSLRILWELWGPSPRYEKM